MPAEKSNVIEEGQKELQRLRQLKKEVLSKMPEQTSFLTKALVTLLEKQLDKLDEKIKKVEEKLIEATKASDLVNPDVLDKVKDIIEDVAEGKTDDAIETVKDIAEDKVDEIIDDKIKDGVIADTVKDVIDHAMDGDKDGVIDALKDGVQDKADEAIDKHVKDEKIAAILKDVVDGAIDGEWDSLLDIVKDGVVDIAEGKLEDFINKLLELFEAQIKIKIEFDMKEEAKTLIPKALQETKAKTGPHWSVELAKNLSIRLVKETAVIIKAEIKRLTSEGGLKILTTIAKDALIATLQSGLAGRTIKDILKELVQQIGQHPEFKKIIKDFKRKMLIMFLTVAEQEVEKTVGPVIDAFLRVHNPWLGSLLKTPKFAMKVGPMWGCVNLVLSVQADLTAKLTTKRKGLGAIGKGGLAGKAYAGVGISIGYDIPLVGNISIEGGVQGGPEINASASLQFSFKNAVIHAKVVPVTIDIDMSARLYLDTPIPTRILKYVPAYLSSTTVVGQSLFYPLGRLNVLTATTPGYTLTFDLVNKKYSYIGASGKYNVSVHPKVKAYLKDAKDAILEAAQSVLDAVDPTTWDLNPFDDDGWAGGWF
ncbi:MAG: Unknown protein [uncultured Aureispira sp.]|uniref:Uncharacterized protein n=1 Tax=uncultured Aureispira sp. TaxID=1331704 RepID=A0A6S6SJ73_9BACT|nr:MAG: Unknown protein [uncultured Aureispira sp.]